MLGAARRRGGLLGALVRSLCRPLDASGTGERADIIVVLGTPVRDGRLGPVGRERVEAGVAAWRAGRAPLLLFTGGRTDPSPWADFRALLRRDASVRHRPSSAAEAAVMAAHARDLGVPEHAILVEDQAHSTEENARYAAAMMRARGLGRALIVTQPFHVKRSLRHFAREGVAAAALALPESRIFGGGRDSLRAIRWVVREYVVLGLEQLGRM